MSAGCQVPGCTYPLQRSGLCEWHRRNGTPDGFVSPGKQKRDKAKQARRKLAAEPPVFTKTGKPRCDECGARDPRKSYRLDTNLRPSYRLLDKPCREKLGYQLVNWDRPYAEITGREIMRGAA